MKDYEMIERVSEAIRRTPNASDYNELVAINAIKAMREPTEKMINSPMARCYNTGPYGDKEVRRIFTAMIDAVIND